VTVEQRLSSMIARCASDPARVAVDEGDALAAEVGGELERHWRIAVVRRAIAVAPDDVRELYGALVDRYREGRELGEVRALGDEIRAREAAGELPSTLVARSERKR